MIVRPRLHWLRMLFVWRGSVLKQVLPQLLIIAAYATLATAVVKHLGWHAGLNTLPFSLLGVAIAIFLGFRNNASYERFWEARKLWGALVIESRSLVRQIATLTDSTADEKRALVRLVIAFSHALRIQLRREADASSLQHYFSDETTWRRIEAAQFRPAMILLLISERLATLRRGGKLDPVLVPALEATVGAHSGILAGCERIANTPIPFTYSVIIHRIIYAYVLLLPLGMVEAVGWWTPVMVGFNAYMFITLEALSHEIEEPFGTMPNDLALGALCHTIESSLCELAGEPMPGPAPTAVDFVLT